MRILEENQKEMIIVNDHDDVLAKVIINPLMDFGRKQETIKNLIELFNKDNN